MAIHHVVLFKFRTDAPPGAIEAYLRELDRLPDLNADIRNWVSGWSPEPRFHNGDFDYGIACDLDDEAAMERYMAHPGHLRLGAFLGDVLEKNLTFDFVIDAHVASEAPTSIPDTQIIGLRIEKATSAIAASGRTVGRVKTVPNAAWAEGFVLADRGGEGDTVDLVVSGATRVPAGEPYVPRNGS